MRKFLAAILSVICLSCLAIAFGCSGAPNYYILEYGAIEGITLDFGEIQSGAQVKEGYTVRFTMSINENKVMGEPTVLVNGDSAYPDLQGVYSFEMEKDTTVTVSGVYAISSFDVVFDKADWRISYLDSEGKQLPSYTDDNGREVTKIEDVDFGEEVKFKLNLSVYYDKNCDFAVRANTNILRPDENGVYSFTVTNATTVAVENLELDTSFLDRKDGGNGTAEDPFIIERPIDLYVVADRVNDSFDASGKYSLGYYKMTKDIDMEGEQLFIIGDCTTTSSYFMGDFDGNGHTIRNYYIRDRLIEQSTYQEVFLSYIGLFGQVVASIYGPASVHDLTLEDFEIEVDATISDEYFSVGGIAGAVVGSTVSNCKVTNGVITAKASNNDAKDNISFGYMGGITGFMQSVSNDSAALNGVISGCYSDVLVGGDSGFVLAAGGIAGNVTAEDERAVSYVLNSIYAGEEVYGAMRTGGIVGQLSNYCAVKNCGSYGFVDANNRIANSRFTEFFLRAYAGGIAGYADRDSVMSDSFSLAETSASASFNANYASSGDIAGGTNDGGELIAAHAAIVFNCTSTSSDINKNYLVNTLGWNENDWSFDGEYPEVKANKGVKDISIETVNGNNNVKRELSSQEYRTAGEWYGNGLDEFVTSANLRSYGYFFDKELTQKVPAAYVLTGGETLYYGLADYSEVAGEYYLQTAVKGSGIYIQLSPDGELLYRNGALNLQTTYIYDGTQVTMFGCPAFEEVETSYVYDENGNIVLDENNNPQTTETPYYSDGVASLVDGKLVLIDNITYTDSQPLYAVKKFDNFVYGGYYSGSDEYLFSTDRTGKVNSREFTYTVVGTTLMLTYGDGTTLTGTVENGKVKTVGSATLAKYDSYMGTWEKSAATHGEYTFDGKGGWSYEFYEYVNGEKQVLKTESGTYVCESDGSLTLNNGVIANFDKNGMLTITSTDLTQSYYGEFSFAGTWRFAFVDEAMEITFGGISKDGYGTASVKYETLSSAIDFTYHVITEGGENYVYLYDYDVVMGMLYFDPSDLTLKGMIYSYATDQMVYEYVSGNQTIHPVAFTLYDEFYGEWLGEEWGLLNFNGFGSYNLASVFADVDGKKVNITTAVSGSVKIGSENASYKLENANMKGTLVYRGVTYSIEYDEVSGCINVSGDGKNFKLVRPDGMYGVKLVSGDGKLYAFDGGSAHANGGKVTAGDTTYKYKVTANGAIELYSANLKVGTITAVDGVYKLAIGGDTVTLTIYNEFTGSWKVGGTFKELVIGEINASLVAQGSYLGTNVTFNYNAAEEQLSFVYGGVTYYVKAFSSATTGTELLISNAQNMLGSSVYCVKSGILDGYEGTYYNTNGDSFSLDGFSGSAYTKGTAKIVGKGEDAGVVYSYSKNVFDVFELRKDTDYRVLVACEKDVDGAYVNENGDKAFLLVEPDALYLKTATDYFGTGYTFSGLGEVADKDGNVYSYTVIPQTDADKLRLVCRMTFTDTDGKEYPVEFGYRSTSYTVTFTDELTGTTIFWTERDGFSGMNTTDYQYLFVSAGWLEYTVARTVGGISNSTVTLYSYVIDGYDNDKKVYTLTLTDEDGALYTATLDLGGEDGATIKVEKK